MKRSEAITKLLSKVVSPFEVIREQSYNDGTYHRRAEKLLEFIEREIGMLPPYNPEYINYDNNSAGLNKKCSWEKE